MKVSSIVLAGIMSALTACQSANYMAEPDDVAEDPWSLLSPEDRDKILRKFAEMQSQPSRQGYWQCDGYLTDVERENFCSSETPNAWVPFDFQGETYYIQPLARGNQ